MRATVRLWVFPALVSAAVGVGGLGCGTSGEPGCPLGQLECGGGCVDPKVDPSHCGGCGTSCGPGQVCARGQCALTCPAGLSTCAGSCRDLASDRAHCGACGNPCTTGLACFGGSCAPSCPPGQTECNSACTDTRFDPLHCGGCGGACTAPENAQPVCANGLCAHVCQPGFADCDGDESNGCEQNIASDENHCGACGVTCGDPAMATVLCVEGACALDACAGGWGDCDGELGNGCEEALATSSSHCGACGNTCPRDLLCQDGECVEPPSRLTPGLTTIIVARDGVEATCTEWAGNLCTQPKLRPLQLSCASYAHAGEWHAVHFDANFYCFYATGDRTVVSSTTEATFTGPPTVHGHWSSSTCAPGAATEPHGYPSGQLSMGTSLAWDWDRGAIGNVAAECLW